MDSAVMKKQLVDTCWLTSCYEQDAATWIFYRDALMEERWCATRLRLVICFCWQKYCLMTSSVTMTYLSCPCFNIAHPYVRLTLPISSAVWNLWLTDRHLFRAVSLSPCLPATLLAAMCFTKCNTTIDYVAILLAWSSISWCN